VAKKHCPQLVNDINNRAMNNKSGKAITGDDLLNSAKIWEESRDYKKAIDTYLEIKQEITNMACIKLKNIQRFEMAAELYENIG
jgi:hypothetical protein